MDAVVLEMLVEGGDAHRPDAFGNQVTDWIIHHRRRDAGSHPEAVGEIGRDVEFAAADVNIAMSRLAEGDDPWIETMDEGAEGKEVQRASRTDIQTIFHCFC